MDYIINCACLIKMQDRETGSVVDNEECFNKIRISTKKLTFGDLLTLKDRVEEKLHAQYEHDEYFSFVSIEKTYMVVEWELIKTGLKMEFEIEKLLETAPTDWNVMNKEVYVLANKIKSQGKKVATM